MLGLGWAFGEKKSEKSCFHAEECIYNLQISLSKLISLSGSPLLALCATFGAEHNSSQVGICDPRTIEFSRTFFEVKSF